MSATSSVKCRQESRSPDASATEYWLSVETVRFVINECY